MEGFDQHLAIHAHRNDGRVYVRVIEDGNLAGVMALSPKGWANLRYRLHCTDSPEGELLITEGTA